jgi:hypothetical protein
VFCMVSMLGVLFTPFPSTLSARPNDLSKIQGVYYVVEQPVSSVLPSMPCMVAALQATNARRVVVHLGGFGASSMKTVVLLGTAPWLETLAAMSSRLWSSADRKRLRPLACTTSSGVTGGEGLSGSAAYPRFFCDAWFSLASKFSGPLDPGPLGVFFWRLQRPQNCVAFIMHCLLSFSSCPYFICVFRFHKRC